MYSLRYPFSDRQPNDTYLKITVLKKVNSSVGGASRGGQFFQNNNPTDITRSLQPEQRRSQTTGIMFLPLPIGLQDSNQVEWNEGSLNRLEQGGVNLGSSVINALTVGDMDAAKAALDSLKNNATNAGEQVLNPEIQRALQSAVSTALLQLGNSTIQRGQLLSRTTGQAINSYQELLFKGVTLRSFDYSFEMTPRSPEEGNECKRIINAFKRASAAKDGSNGWFISAPDVFELEFMKGGEKHPFLYSHRLSALTSVSVNYSGSTPNNYAAYGDGTPTKLELQLSFQELDPIYESDYEEFGSRDNISGGTLDRGVGY